MLKTPLEWMQSLGQAIRARRLAQGWSQAEAAERAGMSERTWRRLEHRGQATTENLVNAAIALRCEEHLAGLFPMPAARSMDALLERQRHAAEPRQRQRVGRGRRA